MATAESAALLPVLDFNWEAVSEQPSMKSTGHEAASALRLIIQTVAGSNHAQEAVEALVEKTEESFGFGEVARLFEELAATLK